MAAGAHNDEILKLAKPGDLIEFPRELGYSHFAVYIGDGMTVGKEGDFESVDWIDLMDKILNTAESYDISGRVVKKHLNDVAGKDKAYISNKDDKKEPFSSQEVVQRAEGEIGQSSYNLLIKNCEHFATWCRYGIAWCDQLLEKPIPYLEGSGISEATAQALVEKFRASLY